MRRVKPWLAFFFTLFGLPATSLVEAQWVMAARAAKNRIQQMTQKSGNGGYAVAIVLLEAAPAAVYDRTLKSLQAHPEIKITKNDQKMGRIDISKDQQVAGFQINALSDKLTQLIIASSVTDQTNSGSTFMVVEAVLRVCKEMDVKCTVEAN